MKSLVNPTDRGFKTALGVGKIGRLKQSTGSENWSFPTEVNGATGSPTTLGEKTGGNPALDTKEESGPMPNGLC